MPIPGWFTSGKKSALELSTLQALRIFTSVMEKLFYPANQLCSFFILSSPSPSTVMEGSGGAPGYTEQCFKAIALNTFKACVRKAQDLVVKALREHLTERMRGANQKAISALESRETSQRWGEAERNQVNPDSPQGRRYQERTNSEKRGLSTVAVFVSSYISFWHLLCFQHP